MTGWNGDEKLQDLAIIGKAQYTKESVTIDGKYITADGPDSADEFAKALWKML